MAVGIYLLVFVASFILASPIGGNIGRLGAALGVPLAVGLLWLPRRRALAMVAAPMTILQWGPAGAANRTRPGAQRFYFEPLIDYIDNQPVGSRSCEGFRREVNLSDKAMIEGIATSLAQYVTVKTFASALRSRVVEELVPTLEGDGRRYQ